MRSRLAVALAMTAACGTALLYAEPDPSAQTAIDAVAVAPPDALLEVPTFSGLHGLDAEDPLTPSMGLFPPPVVADAATSPLTAAPPQLVFPSSYTPPDIAPTTSYVPPADYTSAPSGAPSGSGSSGPVASADAGFATPEPETDFEPVDPPKPTPTTAPTPSPSPTPTHAPDPTPSPTPTPEPEPVADPCADALALEWTCVVDEDAEPVDHTDPDAVEDEETLLALVPTEADGPDGTAWELTLDLRDGDEPVKDGQEPAAGTVIVVGTTDLVREALAAYLEQLRETFPSAVLLSVVDPATEPSPEPTPSAVPAG